MSSIHRIMELQELIKICDEDLNIRDNTDKQRRLIVDQLREYQKEYHALTGTRYIIPYANYQREIA